MRFSLVFCSALSFVGAVADEECSTVSLLQVPLARRSGGSNHGQHSASGLHSVDAPESFQERPGLASGRVDHIEYGILLKNWYAIDMPAGTLTLDAVITTRWQDIRAVKLIPKTSSSLKLSLRSVERGDIWTPDVKVSNVALGGSDLISSAYSVHRNGTVTHVQRIGLKMEEDYVTEEFPFDTQTVHIKIASFSHMGDEVVLRATEDEGMWGASPEVFVNTPWLLQNASLHTIIENDGLLQKSRGLLSVIVKRHPAQYMSSIFIPTIVLLVMTWCSLWFPVEASYAMPRVAVSVISVLCTLSLSQRASTMIPATGVMTWMDKYLEICVELQFLSMVFNALILSISARSGYRELANALDTELMFAYPSITGVVLTCVAFGFIMVGRVVILAYLVTYSLVTAVRYAHWRSKGSLERQGSLEGQGSF